MPVEDFYAALRRGDKKATHPLPARGVYVKCALPKSNIIDHKRIRRYLRSRENIPIYIVAGEGVQIRVYQVIKQKVNDVKDSTIFVQDFDYNNMVHGYIGKRDTSVPVTRPLGARNPQLSLRTLSIGDTVNIWLRDDAIKDVRGLYLPQKSPKK